MPRFDRFFDQEFGDLKTQILEMGSAVESAIECALKGLTLRNADIFKQVHLLETKINHFHILNDETCLRVLARQAPLATDLRFVISCIKINSDLERMGDQAVNIAHCGRHYISSVEFAGSQAKPLVHLPQMAEEVRWMTRQSLDAFFRQDQELARSVIVKDDTVDAFKNSIFHELVALMKTDPKTVERAMDLILVARNLERIGDHATNIAEDVIFVASGVDIRHGSQKSV